MFIFLLIVIILCSCVGFYLMYICWNMDFTFLALCLLVTGISLIGLPGFFLDYYKDTTSKYVLITRIDNNKYMECINNKNYLIYENVSMALVNDGESCIDRLYGYKEKKALEKNGLEFIVYNQQGLFKEPKSDERNYTK